MLILIFFLLAFILPFLFIKKRSEESENALDKSVASYIKGILCIFVMLHNLGLDYLHENF